MDLLHSVSAFKTSFRPYLGSPMTNAAKISRALADFLQNPNEHNRLVAAELGRDAYQQGVGVLEWAGAVHSVIADALQPVHGKSVREGVSKIAQVFLMECLFAYEAAMQGARESTMALRSQIERMGAQDKLIAREMHDTASQLLVSAHMELHLAA